jgi:predicted Zn-dependent peptidase
MNPFSRLLVPAFHALAVATLAACAAAPARQPAAAGPAISSEPAPLSALVATVDIPYESFTLPNGLVTIVHTDRKSPVVGVTVYYRAGSKHEPRGRTGFAHLFEHLMFGGSENVENFDIPLEAAGSTTTNGSTWYDRTNYVETVPTGALDLALFMESDRMGHLLGAVTQEKLDRQRGVVQNEKREGDNRPYGLMDYKIDDALLPVGHPYRHSTIGSMADLDAASLADVHTWFIDNYGPNNAILVLAGDIDAATARPLVERWFGSIPRGPEVRQPTAGPVTLAAPVREVMTDQVPVVRIHRAWTGPALADPDAVTLALGMHVLGGLESSRLETALVRREQLAVAVSAVSQQHEQLGFLRATMDVKPGVDPAEAEQRFDAVIARLLAEGPTADELQRAATQIVSAQIGALEQVGGFSGKGATLAEGLLYAGDPAHYKTELKRLAELTPAQVQSTLQRWLERPSYTLVVVPGDRTEDGALMGGWGDEALVPAPAADVQEPVPQVVRGPSREFPPVAAVGELTFPAIERARLSNGMEVVLARRTAVPKVSMALAFDAGNAADGAARAGTQSLMMELLREGTLTRNAEDIATAQERLGAAIKTGTTTDASTVTMTALTANLGPSLQLMADIVRNPAFAPGDVNRVRDQRLAAIAQEQADPEALAQRALGPVIYGEGHPYGSVGGSGKASAIESLTPEILAEEHARWLRPEGARLTAVGDVTLAELLPALESAFGDWRGAEVVARPKSLAGPVPAARPRLVVIDIPDRPQSVLLLARVLPLDGARQGIEPLELANEVIGSGFLSRLNRDLREEKGWTYWIRSALTDVAGPRALAVVTSVQADRTADSIRLILERMDAFANGSEGVDAVELQRVTEGNVRGLPNRYQTNGQVLAALLANQKFRRPDNYQAMLPTIYRDIGASQIDAAAREFLSPAELAIVVVGDRRQIDGQLATLGMPIEYLDAQQL